MTTTTQATSIHKVRRDAAGGKRGQGWQLQAQAKKVRRADPTKNAVGRADASLTSVAGLVPFGQFVRGLGIDWELKQLFSPIKTGLRVVYPMPEQLRLLIDANAVVHSVADCGLLPDDDEDDYTIFSMISDSSRFHLTPPC